VVTKRIEMHDWLQISLSHASKLVFSRVPIVTQSACLLRLVRPSTLMYQHGYHWTDLGEIWFWRLV
jgi:hypothetical protein